MAERIRNGSDSDVVAEVVLKAVTAAAPAVRYTAGFGGGSALLPTGIFDRVVRKAFVLE